jgi:hypothetical protein
MLSCHVCKTKDWLIGCISPSAAALVAKTRGDMLTSCSRDTMRCHVMCAAVLLSRPCPPPTAGARGPSRWEPVACASRALVPGGILWNVLECCGMLWNLVVWRARVGVGSCARLLRACPNVQPTCRTRQRIVWDVRAASSSSCDTACPGMQCATLNPKPRTQRTSHEQSVMFACRG